MIFRLDIYAATTIVTLLLIIIILSILAQQTVRFGEAPDPHFNYMHSDNDVNVCAFSLGGHLGFNATHNSSDEIKCFLKDTVTTQVRTLWKDCPYTLYHVLHDAHKSQRKALRVLVIVDFLTLTELDDEGKRTPGQLYGTPRRTLWGQRQHDNLSRILKVSCNDWRKALCAQHPEDFSKDDHDIEIVAVVEPNPRRSKHDPSSLHFTPYQSIENGLRYSTDFDPQSLPWNGLVEDLNIGVPSDQSANSTLKDHGIDITIVYTSGNDMPYVFGHIDQPKFTYTTLGTKHVCTGQCFRHGATIVINDAYGTHLLDDDLNVGRIPWKTLLGYYLILCLIGSSLGIMIRRRLLRTTEMLIIIGLSTLICGALVVMGEVPPPPVVDGQPTRFATDQMPVALMLHELGHLLLMDDYYERSLTLEDKPLQRGLLGLRRPLQACNDKILQPVTVMGAENHITSLDRHFVCAMWAMLQGKAYQPKDLADWELPYDNTATPIGHDDALTDEIDELTDADRPLRDVLEANCALADTDEWVPSQQCMPVKTERVQLSEHRQIAGLYFEVAPWLELIFATLLAYYLLQLVRKNDLKDRKRVSFRELLNTRAILLLLLFIVMVNVRTHEIAKCVALEHSFASHVAIVSVLLAIPLIPLILRRLNILPREQQRIAPIGSEGVRSRVPAPNNATNSTGAENRPLPLSSDHRTNIRGLGNGMAMGDRLAGEVEPLLREPSREPALPRTTR